MHDLSGIWRLVEARAFDDDGHELPPPLGPNPMGVVIFDAERLLVAANDGRKTVPPDAVPRAFVSYCGAYRFDGTDLVTRVDGASRPDITADQVRRIRFEGPNRMVITPISPVLGRNAGLVLVWERAG